MHSLPAIGTEHLLPPANGWGKGGLYKHRDYGGYVTIMGALLLLLCLAPLR